MTRDKLLEIAKSVYGQETKWHGTSLHRLELLAERLIAAAREEDAAEQNKEQA